MKKLLKPVSILFIAIALFAVPGTISKTSAAPSLAAAHESSTQLKSPGQTLRSLRVCYYLEAAFLPCLWPFLEGHIMFPRGSWI